VREGIFSLCILFTHASGAMASVTGIIRYKYAEKKGTRKEQGRAKDNGGGRRCGKQARTKLDRAGRYGRNDTIREDRRAGGERKGGKAVPKRGRRNCSRTGKSRGRPIGRGRGRASWPAVFIVSRVDSRSPALIKYLTHPRRARSVPRA